MEAEFKLHFLNGYRLILGTYYMSCVLYYIVWKMCQNGYVLHREAGSDYARLWKETKKILNDLPLSTHLFTASPFTQDCNIILSRKHSKYIPDINEWN